MKNIREIYHKKLLAKIYLISLIKSTKIYNGAVFIGAPCRQFKHYIKLWIWCGHKCHSQVPSLVMHATLNHIITMTHDTESATRFSTE